MRTIAIYLLLVFGMLYSTLTAGCTPGSRDRIAAAGAAAVVDCLAPEVKGLAPLAKSVAPAVIDGSFEWSQLEDAAVAMGARAGGCLLKNVYDLVPKPSGMIGTSPGLQAIRGLRARTSTEFTYKTAAGEL